MKRARKKQSRVVLEICAESANRTDKVFGIAMGVLNPPIAENIRLDVILNSRMGLRLSGLGGSTAVVHVTGNRLHMVDEADEYDIMGNNEPSITLPQGIVDMDMFLNNSIVFGNSGSSEGNSSESGSDESGSGRCRSGDEDDDGDEDHDSESEDIVPVKPHVKKITALVEAPTQKPKRDPHVEGSGESPAKKKKKSAGLPIVTHKSGLKYQDTIVGSGKPTKKGHNVAIHYVLRLENGKVIDRADRKRPFKFRLGIGECVKGFDIGVMGMREGGERHLIVPPQLGYGNNPPPGIPRNATLYFDVGVIKAF